VRAPLEPTSNVAYRAPSVTVLRRPRTGRSRFPRTGHRPTGARQCAVAAGDDRGVVGGGERVVGMGAAVLDGVGRRRRAELGQAGARFVTAATAVSAVWEAGVVAVVVRNDEPPDEHPVIRSTTPTTPAPVMTRSRAPIAVPLPVDGRIGPCPPVRSGCRRGSHRPRDVRPPSSAVWVSFSSGPSFPAGLGPEAGEADDGPAPARSAADAGLRPLSVER